MIETNFFEEQRNMTRRQWYKPWYIWLGPLAFLALFHLSLHTIGKYETKLKIGYPAQRDLARKVWGMLFFFMLVVIAAPVVVVGLLAEWLLGAPENFSLGSWPWVYIYPVMVYANYRHVLWREKNISPLLQKRDTTMHDGSTGKDQS